MCTSILSSHRDKNIHTSGVTYLQLETSQPEITDENFSRPVGFSFSFTSQAMVTEDSALRQHEPLAQPAAGPGRPGVNVGNVPAAVACSCVPTVVHSSYLFSFQVVSHNINRLVPSFLRAESCRKQSRQSTDSRVPLSSGWHGMHTYPAIEDVRTNQFYGVAFHRAF